MAIDVKGYKKKVLDQKPTFNLVPFIDILFTLMIFLVVTSSFNTAVDMQAADDSASGKPESDISGGEEYYIVPVANLHTVTVNGQDMSSEIRNGAIGVHAEVIDNGQVSIKPGEIDIQTPSGFDASKAVHVPKT